MSFTLTIDLTRDRKKQVGQRLTREKKTDKKIFYRAARLYVQPNLKRRGQRQGQVPWNVLCLDGVLARKCLSYEYAG